MAFCLDLRKNYGRNVGYSVIIQISSLDFLLPCCNRRMAGRCQRRRGALSSDGTGTTEMHCISSDGELTEFPRKGEKLRMKLLLVDQDRDLVEMLTSWLKTLGFDVHRAYTGERARSEWEKVQPDMVILDTQLKDVQDEIQCLEAGADDYLRKPFYPSQLLARIRTLSRRGRFTAQQRPFSVITVGPVCVDSLHNEVTINGKTSRLTPTESKLLHLLAINANHVCTADQIVSYVWGCSNDGDTSLIKAHIHHVRQKVEPGPNKSCYILTVPGVGYSLVYHPVEEGRTKEVGHTLPVVSG